jgi:hypothetical protein
MARNVAVPDYFLQSWSSYLLVPRGPWEIVQVGSDEFVLRSCSGEQIASLKSMNHACWESFCRLLVGLPNTMQGALGDLAHVSGMKTLLRAAFAASAYQDVEVQPDHALRLSDALDALRKVEKTFPLHEGEDFLRWVERLSDRIEFLEELALDVEQV